MKHFITLFFAITFLQLSSQDEIIITNLVEVKPDRFKDYKGSAYLFSESVIMDITSIGGVLFNDIKGNYNGYDEVFEIFHEGKYTILPPEFYNIVVIKKEKNEKLLADFSSDLIFKSNLHSTFYEKFVQVMHEGSSYTLIRQFYTTDGESKINAPGTTETYLRLTNKEQLFLIQGQNLSKFKPSKKSLEKLFKNDPEILEYINKSKNKFKKIDEITNMLTELGK